MNACTDRDVDSCIRIHCAVRLYRELAAQGIKFIDLDKIIEMVDRL